jgi:tetratricopeptide (TPR) repeat protein
MAREFQPKAGDDRRESRLMQGLVFGAICVVIIVGYAYLARLGGSEWSLTDAAKEDYNLLVDGFRAGQLSLKKDVPPGFARLADPYDPVANHLYQLLPYRMTDLSYYKGRLYAYFGVTPVLLLFWPYLALTGRHLFERQAMTVFCGMGFLAATGLLLGLWRRYFAEVSLWVVAAGAFALGLATGVPVILPHSDIHDVVVSCGYMLTMLALAALWRAMHESRKRSQWLAAASLAYGLALGARPNLLFGAVILLVPVVQTRYERRPIGGLLAAALAPITLIGLGLLLYNALRFDNPLEFGYTYHLGAKRLLDLKSFSPRYLWFDFRMYFLEPARWHAPFPFVHAADPGPLPARYHSVKNAFGALTNIPVVWLALALPLAWSGRPDDEARRVLRGFLLAVCLLLGICTLTLCFFFAANIRYALEFLPALALLAVVGILGLECRLADRPSWRRAARWGWGVLLAFSVVFILLATAEEWGYGGCALGTVLLEGGRVSQSIQVLQQSLRIKPDYAYGEEELGNALLAAGQAEDAIRHYEQSLRLDPDNAEAHYNWGVVLDRLDNVPDAVRHYEQALRINPDLVLAHNNLGNALVRLGREPEAIRHWEQALRLKPDFADAHFNLGNALSHAGNLREAVSHYEQALRIDPDLPDVHNNLAAALEDLGREQEAIPHYEQAVRLKPDFAEAHYNLAVALMKQGALEQAIRHFEQALQSNPDYAEAHNNLGTALMGQDEVQQAVQHYEQALRIKPDFVEAHYNLGVALESLGRKQDAIQQYEQALRLKPDFVQAQNALARVRAAQ